jgi:alkyl hydroperoxide reductase subunit AhpF
MFLGSSIAYALAFVSDTGEKKQQEYIFNHPLTNTEEVPFLQNNIVVVKYFMSANCTECQSVDDTLSEVYSQLKPQLAIEKIDITAWPDETLELNITTVPTIYIKGFTLFSKICDLYFEPIEACGGLPLMPIG